MKRLEPNALLAISTVFALFFVVAAASLSATGNTALKYVALGLACPVGFVFLNAALMKRTKRKPRALIMPEAPATAAWASIFPMMVLLSAVLPVLAPGGDYGLMIIIAGIFTGVTIESALEARRRNLRPDGK